MDRLKMFKRVMEKSNSSRVLLLTNHYQIIGNVYECEECNKDEFINLTHVSLCNINDIYDGICESSSNYDWLHINIDKVVGFTFLK